MKRNERIIIGSILFGICLLTLGDLTNDSQEGVHWWHVLIEGIVAASALGGTFLLLKGTFNLRKKLERERKVSAHLQEEAMVWRLQSKKYLDGLSHAIDEQLSAWNLTGSEKEVAFLLLKGFSSKEIAEFRNTAPKTVRTQSMAVYAKAGLSGRSQLAAFFLEDLLLPSQES